MSRLDQIKNVPDTDACVEWVGSVRRHGYGQVRIGKSIASAHRVAYEIHRGSAAGMFVLHKCDNPRCINPAHLFLGTQRDNMVDMTSKGRGVTPVQTVGESHKWAKLKDSEAVEVLELVRDGKLAQTEIGKMFGVSQATVSRIKMRSAR
jgi:predicted DNA-binding protein (UPF0251 family)